MLEILKFIFSSFWVWLGTVILVAVVIQSLVTAVVLVDRILRKK